MRFEQCLSTTESLPVPTHGRAVLAPMSGITDVGFRRLAARFGAGLVVTEMVASFGLVRRDAQARLRLEGSGIRPHVVQLVGRDPASMGEAARLAEASGADIIDLNFGCPAKRVTGGLAGSALMREPDLAVRIAAAVTTAVSVPVTAKMRLGWDTVTANAPALTVALAGIGVRAVTVHGRTRQQFYDGQADWAAIRAVVEASPVPVTANGDVSTLAGARACLAQSGASAVMIGRAALGRPWLVGEIAAALDGRSYASPAPDERMAAAIEHYETMLSLYGRAVGTRHARKHLAAYAGRAAEAGFGLDAADRQEIVTSREPARVIRLLGRIYETPLRSAA